jgi:hypothetical protein
MPELKGEGTIGVKGEGIAIGVHGTILAPGLPVTVGVKGEGGGGMRAPVGGTSVPISIALGVQGISSDPNGCGVEGINEAGIGVRGRGDVGIAGEGVGIGVAGRGIQVGVQGTILTPAFPVTAGVKGVGGAGMQAPGGGGISIPISIAMGVQGISSDPYGCGVEGINEAGIGVRGRGGRLAASFEGNVAVTGNIEVAGDIVLANADCAEDFDIADVEPIPPGTVMVVGDDGVLHQSQQAYDTCVAGVISGAGNFRPGVVLDKQPLKPSRKPIALLGKVYCKADASYAPIKTGDLLTTSDTPGHAMKATDPMRAFGAVIGKALRPLKDGQGLIPILIALQ